MGMVYQFKSGSRLTGDPQKVGEALHRIYERDGVMECPAIVTEARSEDSVLHPYFEWDDEKAAEQHRLAQARTLANNIRVIRTEETQQTAPAFVSVMVSVPDAKNSPSRECAEEPEETTVRAYVPVEVALADTDLRRQAIQSVVMGIGALQRRLHEMKEFAQELESLEALKQLIAAKM